MSKRDFYDILGLKKEATADEIKKAYRKLAKEYHPDHNPGDAKAEEKFKELQEANATLSDPKKRGEYDQFGRAGVGSFQTDPGGSKVYKWGGGSKVNVDDLEELLSAFGGGGGGRRASIFDQIFSGSGQGRGGGRYVEEEDFGGQEQLQEVRLSFDQAIHGTTLVLQQAGSGTRSGQKLEVKIPPGVRDGQRIRIRGQSAQGRSHRPSEDIQLVCRIQPHAYFRREGDDIYLDVPIGITEAALGTQVEVPTLDGRATIKIPAGTRSGAKLRLRGKGVGGGAGTRGDFFAVIQIVPPKSLTSEQQSALRALNEQLPENPRDGVPWAN